MEPFYMASVLYGDDTGDWAGGENPLRTLERVDFWRTNAERIRSEPFYPSNPDALSVPLPLELEAVTEVGLTFRGTAAAFRQVLGVDPDGVVGAVGFDGPLLDLDALDVGVEIALAAKLVTGPTRRGVLAGLGALGVAACVGDGPGKDPDDPDPTGDTAAPIDTGSGPSVCDEGASLPWPTKTEEIPEALGILDTHAAGLRGLGEVVAIIDSGVALAGPANDVELVSVGGLDPSTDELGHGTAVFEHLRATAPDVDVRSVKFIDASGWANFPVAGVQRAVARGVRAPDVMVCSWVMLELSVALQREIANAVERGVVVVFAAGNGEMTDRPASEASPVSTVDVSTEQIVEISNVSYASRQVHAVAHPDALVVGGTTAFCNDDRLVEETVATSYESQLFGADGLVVSGLTLDGQSWNGARSVPDVCGLAAERPQPAGALPALTRTRTAIDSTLDRKPDGTGPDDGFAFTAGSSMAAAHVAGVVALVRQNYGNVLSVRAIKNVLMTTASNAGWRPRTGWGLVRASMQAAPGERPTAMTWLEPTATPYLRATVPDVGPVGPRPVLTDANGLPSCPDLFFRADDTDENVQTRFGLTAKHVPGALMREGGARVSRFLYVRVTNRGLTEYSDVGYVYLVRDDADNPGRFQVTAFDSRDVVVSAGDFVAVPVAAIPGDVWGVVVEVQDPATSNPIVVPGPYTSQELVALVAENRTVGAIALPGGA